MRDMDQGRTGVDFSPARESAGNYAMNHFSRLERGSSALLTELTSGDGMLYQPAEQAAA